MATGYLTWVAPLLVSAHLPCKKSDRRTGPSDLPFCGSSLSLEPLLSSSEPAFFLALLDFFSLLSFLCFFFLSLSFSFPFRFSFLFFCTQTERLMPCCSTLLHVSKHFASLSHIVLCQTLNS